MTTRPLLLAALGFAVLLAPPPTPLRVMRASPTGDAARDAIITLTFDRPVAGSLDRTVDASRIVRVDPAIDARIGWRDPVTIAIRPRRLLAPDARYTVTVAAGVTAMDGSRLPAPYSFTFRVKGPTLVAGSPAGAGLPGRFLTPGAHFALVYSSPVDLDRLSAAAVLRLGPECAGARIIHLHAVSQRGLRQDDPPQFRSWMPHVDSLRRVVQLVPASPLPLACSGAIVAPTELAASAPAVTAWRFSTYHPLRIDGARCAAGAFCPTGPAVLRFTTPVRGAEVLRHVRILPGVHFTVRDTAAESDEWTLEGTLAPRRTYAIVADTALRDVFGQPLGGNPAVGVRTTGYEPSVSYPYGRITVERGGFGTIAVQHVNVDTLVVRVAAVPDSLEGEFLRRSTWNLGDLWQRVRAHASVARLPVRAGEDRPAVTGVRLPALATGAPAHRAPLAVRIDDPTPDSAHRGMPTVAIAQVTDLGVHAKIGAQSGVVWVTGLDDGKGRAGARVVLHDFTGRAVATAVTDARGIAVLGGYHAAPPAHADSAHGGGDGDAWYGGFEGYVVATLGDDRALSGVSQYDPDLAPWRFNVQAAWGPERFPVAGAVFTERGIYRPGETVHAKAIVRTGPLGALAVPARTDSLRWVFADRDQGTLADTVVALSTFGTADHALRIPPRAALGSYEVAIRVKRDGRWVAIGSASYRVAEYRPPEFLVDMSADSAPRLPGDTLRASVQARYLFGAPMARAVVSWQALATPLSSWALRIPGTDGWFIGESGWWWENDDESARVVASGTDTLDASGARTLRVAAPEPERGRAALVTISASVQDVNRQTVGASATAVVHPASFYIAAKPEGTGYFWTEGKAQRIAVLAVRPTGERVPGVRVAATVARREWHQVHRERDGAAETVGEWVTDTVARCAVTTSADPATCAITPPAGGTYIVSLRARDERGREATTTFYRWATGKEWVPWDDESRLKVDVIADRARYSVGDTATVLFASPFTGAEAWVTVEREGMIEQRRLTITSGSTTLKFPITEAFAPNAFVSILIARGRSAPPGRLDDPGRPTIRVGYTELRVTPEVKRLAVTVAPLAAEYRPGDTARVRVEVKDARGAPRRAEVTLWAVDEGVLSLTGYETPDPLDLLYRERGLGLHLSSNMASVAPQIPEGEKGGRSPGGGGGVGRSDVLRSRFQSTAFFLGSVVTGADGRAVASAKLPDNLTTFRVMAVAVTAGDRYGEGESPMLVTRPIVARPALPRFVRAGDDFTAGTVVNARSGGTPRVTVTAAADGVALRGPGTRTATLEAGRGVEVRFPFRALPGDSATFRFTAGDGRDADGVRVSVPVKPSYHPTFLTVSGTVRDTATMMLAIPDGLDLARSRLLVTLGSSPLAMLRGLADAYRVYPYYCTEQVTSVAMPLLALQRARAAGIDSSARDARGELARAVEIIASRQRDDGGIGYWSATDWTSPWLSAYAGRFLLGARAAGIAVSDTTVARLAAYLRRELHAASDSTPLTPVASWYTLRGVRLADRVAAVDFLSRAGHPDMPAENELLALAPQLRWEDRLLLAEVLARRGAKREALALVAPAWSDVRVEGNRAVLPPAADSGDFYFASRARPMARLLTATLAVNATHPLVGPMVETLVQQGRAGSWLWNTQDVGAVSEALAAYDARQRRAAARGITVSAGGRTLFAVGAPVALGAAADSGVPLTGLVVGAEGARTLRLHVRAAGGAAAPPAYYYVTVREVPIDRPVRPEDRGIQVERWYERYSDGAPVTSVTEGELVRVRLRVTVPAERHFVVLDDALPAGLEAIDLSLRTASALPGPGASLAPASVSDEEEGAGARWWYGRWDSGWWSPWDHEEMRDDRVVYVATMLWPGSYGATYIARATTPGVFVRPPAYAEEMYNPAVSGRSDGGRFTVEARR